MSEVNSKVEEANSKVEEAYYTIISLLSHQNKSAAEIIQYLVSESNLPEEEARNYYVKYMTRRDK